MHAVVLNPPIVNIYSRGLLINNKQFQKRTVNCRIIFHIFIAFSWEGGDGNVKMPSFSFVFIFLRLFHGKNKITTFDCRNDIELNGFCAHKTYAWSAPKWQRNRGWKWHIDTKKTISIGGPHTEMDHIHFPNKRKKNQTAPISFTINSSLISKCVEMSFIKQKQYTGHELHVIGCCCSKWWWLHPSKTHTQKTSNQQNWISSGRVHNFFESIQKRHTSKLNRRKTFFPHQIIQN